MRKSKTIQTSARRTADETTSAGVFQIASGHSGLVYRQTTEQEQQRRVKQLDVRLNSTSGFRTDKSCNVAERIVGQSTCI